MPIYLYRCDECGVEVEEVLPITQRDIPRKHSCGTLLKRALTMPGVIKMSATGSSMALDWLNSRETDHMTPETKQAAYQGCLPHEKTVF